MGDNLSKYHQEKEGSTTGGPASSSNPQVVGGGKSPADLNPTNMGNPMVPMSGGKEIPTMNMGNPMMPMSGGSKGESLPSEAQVMETNPQGHKAAPLSGKLMGKRGGSY